MLKIKDKPIIKYSSNRWFNTNLRVFGQLFIEYITHPTENTITKNQ